MSLQTSITGWPSIGANGERRKSLACIKHVVLFAALRTDATTAPHALARRTLSCLYPHASHRPREHPEMVRLRYKTWEKKYNVIGPTHDLERCDVYADFNFTSGT